MTLNVALLADGGTGVVTTIVATPVFAPWGTAVVITVLLETVNATGLLLNVTLVVPVKPLPLMVSGVPTPPVVRLPRVVTTLVMLGAVTTVKFVCVVAE